MFTANIAQFEPAFSGAAKQKSNFISIVLSLFIKLDLI